MKILGISGIEGSIPFKQAHWPGLDEREYRISQGHDSAAALIIDGKVVAAAEEERFNRRKHSGAFPIGAINYCLQEAGLTVDEIDEIAHGFDYAPYQLLFNLDSFTKELYEEVFSKESLLKLVQRDMPGFPVDRVHQVGHHLAHAASAYFTSGWDECLTVVIDGMGEAHSVSIYHAHGGKLDLVHQLSSNDSIGILYSLVTLHLGFDFNSDEYKIMGLAPYGNSERYRSFFDKAVELQDDGSIRIPILRLNRTRDERENYLNSRQYLGEHLIAERHPDVEITDAHRDVAASLQACLDRTMEHICSHFARKLGLRRLAMAGGVALNCTANGKLMRSGHFDDIFIQPAAGDDGVALGAALYRASLGGDSVNRRLPTPFFGPASEPDEIEEAIAEFGDQIVATRFETLEETCEEAARLVAAGRVIAWFRGRMEFGPRALGHRSILADPGHPAMRDRINAMVKMREAFRPFAPAVTLEQAHQWFEIEPGTELPYMIFIVKVLEAHRDALPAITHVDGTARVQTVSTRDNADFHQLLCAVGRATGREMLLNTSFNVKGQPIVTTPQEAIDTFLKTGIEFLFVENTLLQRAGS
ncbi:MAG: carbamoyltransferase C-terminal domain-containing protein [Blastocatellia bacterium]|nr:carbamoyltransferase C-terminal domain-containing protein [Blastocatellia bacterium]